jgi:hypothetical protein
MKRISSAVFLAVLAFFYLGISLAAAVVITYEFGDGPTVGTYPAAALDAVHDMLVFNGKLWIAKGKGLNSTGRCVIYSYDHDADTLTQEFNVPRGDYSDLPYWRCLGGFNGKLYAGLGQATDSPSSFNTAEIWRRNDDGTWTKMVRFNDRKDVYALYFSAAMGKFYAGVGKTPGYAGTADLYESTDGSTWTLTRNFPKGEQVRSICDFEGKLYVGLRNNARLWEYDGSTWTNRGTPPHVNAQIKTLSVYNGLLFCGCVSAYVYTWDPVNGFRLSGNFSALENEVYHFGQHNGRLYFGTNPIAPGGRIYEFDGSTWRNVYYDPDKIGQIQSVRSYSGLLWHSGGKRRGIDLTVRKSAIVEIDIMPGIFPNKITPNSRSEIPVAILSTADFDAHAHVDPNSLTFGRTGYELSLAFVSAGLEDVNGDGLPDLICHFRTPLTGFRNGDTQGILKGKTVDGTPINGHDSVLIVP